MRCIVALALALTFMTALAQRPGTGTPPTTGNGYTRTVFEINSFSEDNYRLSPNYSNGNVGGTFFLGTEQASYYRCIGDSTQPINWSQYFQLADNHWSERYEANVYCRPGAAVDIACYRQSQTGTETWKKDGTSTTFTRTSNSVTFGDIGYRTIPL